MFHTITRETLEHTLAGIEAVDLLGLRLLQQHQPAADSWFPQDVDPDELVAATTELVDYTRECERAIKRLHRLPPIPLEDRAVEEFCL